MRRLFGLLAVGPVADQTDTRLDATPTQPGEDRRQIVRPLDGSHATDPSDDEARDRNAEQTSQLERRLVGCQSALEVDPEANDLELRARANTEVNELVADVRRNGDENVRLPGQSLLDELERGGAHRVEVPPQNVPVAGVHDDRGRLEAAESGSHPAYSACFGRMGVNDLRPQRSDQPDQPPDGNRVVERGQLPTQLGNRVYRHSELRRYKRH